jgi:hypothetical protein
VSVATGDCDGLTEDVKHRTVGVDRAHQSRDLLRRGRTVDVDRFKLDGTLNPSPNNPPFDVHDYFATTDQELWYSDTNDGAHNGSTSPWLIIEFDVRTCPQTHYGRE